MNTHQHARLTPVGRALVVQRVLREGRPAAQVAQGVGVSVQTVYKWLRRWRLEGAPGLHDRSSRPHRPPRRLARPLRRRIQQLRRQRWSALRIAAQLGLPVSTVVTQRRLGLARLRRLAPPQPVVRYERAHPGELVHVDIKKLGRIGRVGHRIHGDHAIRATGIGWEYVHVCVDDATRLAYTEVLADECGATAAGFLRRAAAWLIAQGVPRVERVMTEPSLRPQPSALHFRARGSRLIRDNHGLVHEELRCFSARLVDLLLRAFCWARPCDSS